MLVTDGLGHVGKPPICTVPCACWIAYAAERASMAPSSSCAFRVHRACMSAGRRSFVGLIPRTLLCMHNYEYTRLKVYSCVGKRKLAAAARLQRGDYWFDLCGLRRISGGMEAHLVIPVNITELANFIQYDHFFFSHSTKIQSCSSTCTCCLSCLS
jgi:hypothetical protein